MAQVFKMIDDIYYDKDIVKILWQMGKFEIADNFGKQRSQAKKTTYGNMPKILLVEDNLMSQKINFAILTSVHFNVDIAKNYWEALKLYHQHLYDIILLDIGLPVKSGIDLCKAIRKYEHKLDKHIAIIALTAFGESAQEDCYAAGVDDFAVKPLPERNLIKLICKWLPKKFFI